MHHIHSVPHHCEVANDLTCSADCVTHCLSNHTAQLTAAGVSSHLLRLGAGVAPVSPAPGVASHLLPPSAEPGVASQLLGPGVAPPRAPPGVASHRFAAAGVASTPESQPPESALGRFLQRQAVTDGHARQLTIPASVLEAQCQIKRCAGDRQVHAALSHLLQFCVCDLSTQPHHVW